MKVENAVGVKAENDSEDQEMTDISNLTHRQTCFLLFTKFTKEVMIYCDSNHLISISGLQFQIGPWPTSILLSVTIEYGNKCFHER